MQLAESGSASDFLADIRARADRSLYFFTKVILAYKDLEDDYHWPFCEEVQNDKYLKQGWLHARGHFKSTIVPKSYPIWSLAKDPCRRFLLVSEADLGASRLLNDLKWHILNNQLFQAVYPELIPPDKNNTKWTESQILLPRPKSFDEPSIMCVGLGAKVTGFHFTDIIYDDVFGEKAALSEAEAERVISWVQYAAGLAHDPATLREKFVGTRWKHGERDVYGWLMIHVPQIKWSVRAAIEDGKPVFPQRFTLDILDDIRKREGDYKFFCQYMNNPIAPEGADFPPDGIKQYHVEEDETGKKCVIVPEDGTPRVNLRSLLRVSFYDPSAGGKTATAENAVITAGMSADRRIFMLDTWMKNCGIGTAVDYWMKVGERFRTYKDYYEQVGAQKAVEDIVKLKNQAHSGRKLFPTPIKPPGGAMNKEDRIRMYAQAAFQEGRVYLRKGMEPLRRQIISFPHGDLVDGFDAAAYCINLLRPPLSDEMYQEQKEQDDAAKIPHPSYSHTAFNYGGYS